MTTAKKTKTKKTKAKAKAKDDATLKHDVLMAALEDAPFDGFTEAVLTRAGETAAADEIALARLFPQGALSLVEAFSDWADDEMVALLEQTGLKKKKIRERISAAVLARLEVLAPHKEAARRAGAWLTLPPHAPLGMTLLYRTVDAMWRATGDTATDFNFYTKRAILAGVYSATLMRWFNDDSEDEDATHAFLAKRIDDVMRFEKFKADVKKRAKDWPSFTEILGGSARARR
jgi:ubiquinone biosynthesis protein COQ9